MKKLLLNIASILLAIAIFYFLGMELVKNWTQIRSYPFQFNPIILTIASLMYVGAIFFLTVGFYMLFHYIRHPLGFFETVIYFIITFPIRYIPGKIWVPVARMRLYKRHGIPSSITLLATGIEVMMEIFAGTYISLFAFFQIDIFGKFSFPAIMATTAAGLVLLSPPIFYFFVNIYLKIVKRKPIEKSHMVSFQKLLLLQTVYVLAVFLVGLSQVMFLQSFAHIPHGNIPLLISIGSFSYVASIVAVFVPSGLGVREGIWYLALRKMLSPHVAMIYSFSSRIWTIVIEALLLFIGLPFLWFRRPTLASPLSKQGKTDGVIRKMTE